MIEFFRIIVRSLDKIVYIVSIPTTNLIEIKQYFSRLNAIVSIQKEQIKQTRC